MSSRIALEMRDIVKRFGASTAVNHVNLLVASSSVHAICGENGAGKSTLMRILAGEYPDYEGSILIDGKEVKIGNPTQAKDYGIEIIHQELGLARSLTVAENILAGRLPHKNGIFLDRKKMQSLSREYLDMVGLHNIKPGMLVSSLSQHEAQLVEIAKALSNHPRILIMDEPTSSLTRDEVELLFQIIRKLKKDGLAIIYISHFLNEVFEVSDYITTLRDGCLITSKAAKELTQQAVVHDMVGRDVNDLYADYKTEFGKCVIEVDELTRNGFFRDISFEVREGEILGICGLAGAGRTELARAIVGIDKWDSGRVTYCGQRLTNKGYAYAIKQNIAYLTEDRKIQGLSLDQSIAENIMSAKLVAQSTDFVVQKTHSSDVEEWMQTLKVIPNEPRKIVGQLSGGNQQKVLLAKWLNTKPKLLILDEPTRGVDVGAKEMIHKTVKTYVQNGNAAILISSDLMELIGLSDRVLILNHGRVFGILNKRECTEESLLLASNGGTAINE